MAGDDGSGLVVVDALHHVLAMLAHRDAVVLHALNVALKLGKLMINSFGQAHAPFDTAHFGRLHAESA